MHRRKAIELTIVAIGALVGAVVFTWPLARAPMRTLPGLGDSVFNAWVLGWIADRTAHALSGVWNAPIFHPYAGTLAFTEPLFGIAVPFAPIYWLTGNAVLLHNVAVWASFVIAATGAYLLGRDLTGESAAGVVCAAVAAFLPYRVAHIAHVQVLMAGWLWWALWSLHRYVAAPSWLGAIRTAALVIVLGLSSLYWIYIGAIPLAIVAAIGWWRHRPPFRVWVPHALAAALLTAAAFVPVAGPMRALTTERSAVARTVDRRSYNAEVRSYLSVEASWIAWGSILRASNGESALFPGLTALVCAGLAFAWRHQNTGQPEPRSTRWPSWRWVYVLIGLIGIVMSLGPVPTYAGHALVKNPLFPWLSAAVPGFAQLRATARFVVLAQLALSVLAAYGVAAWVAARRPAHRPMRITIAVIVVLIFVEGLAVPIGLSAFSPYQRSGDRAASDWLRQHPGGAVAEFPLDGWGPIDYSMAYQFRTLIHGHPIISGVSRFTPPLSAMLGDSDSPLVSPDRMPEAVAFLRAMGVRFVVVHPLLYAQPSLGEAIAAALAAATDHRSVNLGESTILELGDAPVEPQRMAARALPVSAMKVTATAPNVARMLDGDPLTRWLTGRPQTGIDRIDIELGTPTSVSGVSLQLMGRSMNDYPRGLYVSVSSDGRTFVPVFSGSAFPALGAALLRDPVAPIIELKWRPVAARHVRLQQTGTTRRWFWSVHELRLLTPAP